MLRRNIPVQAILFVAASTVLGALCRHAQGDPLAGYSTDTSSGAQFTASASNGYTNSGPSGAIGGFTIAGRYDFTATAIADTYTASYTLDDYLSQVYVSIPGYYVTVASVDCYYGYSGPVGPGSDGPVPSVESYVFTQVEGVGGSSAVLLQGNSTSLSGFYFSDPTQFGANGNWAGALHLAETVTSEPFYLNTGYYTLFSAGVMTFSNLPVGDTALIDLPDTGGLEPVPEPASFVAWAGLAAMGLTGLVWRRRQQLA
jgi:hypothetical protein